MNKTTSWRLLIQPNLAGYRQMAIDEALYTCLRPDSLPVLRFYTWNKPTLSLGYFQDYKRVVCSSFCVHNKINVVRRITGGRCVLHDSEVTYAVAAPLTGVFEKSSLRASYRLIAGALHLGLKELRIKNTSIRDSSVSLPPRYGRPQCFVSVSQFELESENRKTIGSAQKRGRDAFLQHGSILLDFDSRLQSGCVNDPDPQISSRVAPLNRLAGRSVNVEEVIPAFAKAFELYFGVQLAPSDLTSHESDTARNLEDKYRSEEWTKRACR